jgi:dTDP-4-amino-4,6-dideoxygalactose transaminase
MDFIAKPKIPMSSPDLTEAERQAVIDVVNTSYLSMGPKIRAFEKAIADYVGCKYAIAVNSGTSALHLIMHAANIKRNDIVITTPFSFVASTNAILFNDAIPIFVDVDPVTGNIDPQMVEQAVKDLKAGGEAAQKWLPRKGAEDYGALKAVLAVDVFGQPAEYDRLLKICEVHELTLIEDSCEALGSHYKNRKAGKIGKYGAFAFYPNKQITTGEGGIIVTDDDQGAELMDALRNQGRSPGDTWLSHTYLGYNYRMDEMSAALGVVQMERVEALIASRQQVANWYNELLKDHPAIEIPVINPETTRMSWFVYVVRLVKNLDQMEISEKLKDLGVPVRPYFAPIHLQPYMVDRFGYQPGDYPITESLGSRGLALPFSSKMTKDQVEEVCRALKQVCTA